MPMHAHSQTMTSVGGSHSLSPEHASRLRILQNTVASYTFEARPLC